MVCLVFRTKKIYLNHNSTILKETTMRKKVIIPINEVYELRTLWRLAVKNNALSNKQELRFFKSFLEYRVAYSHVTFRRAIGLNNDKQIYDKYCILTQDEYMEPGSYTLIFKEIFEQKLQAIIAKNKENPFIACTPEYKMVNELNQILTNNKLKLDIISTVNIDINNNCEFNVNENAAKIKLELESLIAYQTKCEEELHIIEERTNKLKQNLKIMKNTINTLKSTI